MITDTQSDNMSVCSYSTVGKKKVSFSPMIELRNYNVEDTTNNEMVYYDDIKHSEDINNEEIMMNISFEEMEYRFVIEDCFYKQSYKLPKTLDSIKELKMNNAEVVTMKGKIVEALTTAKQNSTSPIYRIDGILYIKDTKQLVILTEFFLFDFVYRQNTYILNRTIMITSIDYITLSRDGSKVILHLVPQFKNKENINKNYILEHKNLEKVVGCIAATYFYDKKDFGLRMEYVNRQISVIVINEAYEIFNDLQKLNDFHDYKYIYI